MIVYLFYGICLSFVNICFGQGLPDSLLLTQSSTHCITLFRSSGSVSNIAGTPSSPGYVDGLYADARLNYPGALVVNPSNASVMVVDNGNLVIRKVNLATGSISTYAGVFHYSTSIESDNIEFSLLLFLRLPKYFPSLVS